MGGWDAQDQVLSAKGIFCIAEALAKDGYSEASCAALAAMGRVDTHNCARAMDRITTRAVPFLQHIDFYCFKIPVESRRFAGIDFIKQYMILPHELFSVLYHHHRSKFHEVFATRDCDLFWSKQPATRLSASPLFSERDRMWTVPLRLFGDDAPVCTTLSCMTLLLCAAQGFRLKIGGSRIPLSITPMKFCDAASYRYIFRVVKWSLEVLASGYWPQFDHEGKAWPQDSWRFQKGAERLRLAEEYRGLFWEVGGDWKFVKETFAMPQNYNRPDVCHKCCATKTGLNAYMNFASTAPRRARACIRTMDEYRAHFVGIPSPPLSTFPGFDVTVSILLDWVHNGFLGIHLIACGSALVYLAGQGDFGNPAGGDRKVILAVRLKRAWQAFCKWCRDERVGHSQQVFTRASLSVPNAADWEWPCLKAKAHNAMVIVRWLAALTSGTTPDAPRPRRLMARLFWALAEIDHVFARGPQWLDDHHAERVKVARDTLFPSWVALAADACQEGRAAWGFIPKHHLCEHTLDECILNRRNPGGFWNFGEEGMMGESKRATGGNYQPEMGRRILFHLLSRFGIFLDEP